MDESERSEVGLHLRKAVLGEEYVDRVMARSTQFTAEFQDLLTRYTWGEIWTRPAIDIETRRLMVMSTLIALNHEREFRLHVRAALTHGMPRELIKEVILQAAVYCGVAAANTAFEQAVEVFAEMDQGRGG